MTKVRVMQEQADGKHRRIYGAIVMLIESVRIETDMSPATVVNITAPAKAGIEEARSGKGNDDDARNCD
jgi:hypothetical protein